MSSVTPHEKGGQAEKKTSTGRGTQLFKEQAQPIFGPTPELLLDFTRYLTSAKMKRYMERAGGASSEDRQAFLREHLEKRIEKELTNYRGKSYRVLCAYPDIKEINVVPLWNTILTRTNFDLSITADSPSISEALEGIDKRNASRINVGVTIGTDSGGTWDDKSLSALSELQASGFGAFPKFVPQTPPKDWEKSLQKAIQDLNLGKCNRIWGDTASLVAPNKKGLASPKELDAGNDHLAQGFYAALKKIAGDKLEFQHHPPRRFQADWERRLLSSTEDDSFSLLLKYFTDPKAPPKEALKELHDKIVHEEASKIECYAAMYEIYKLTVASEDGDTKAGKRRFVRLYEVVWNRKRTQINRYLESGKFVQQLKEKKRNLPLPECEYHIRTICLLPEGKRIDCWLEIHKDISRFPEDKESVLKRVERYAKRNNIKLPSKTKTLPEKSPEENLLHQLKEAANAAIQQFGNNCEISQLSEQLLNTVTAQIESVSSSIVPIGTESPFSNSEQLPAEPTIPEQAAPPVMSANLDASLELQAKPAVIPQSGVSADPTAPIGPKKHPNTPDQTESPRGRSDSEALPAPLHELLLEQVPPSIEQDSPPEPELPRQEKDPTPSEEGADASG